MNLNNTPTVGHRHFELVTVDVDSFATRRKMPKCLHHQTTDSVDFFIAKVGAERFVEVFNGSQCAYGPYDDSADGSRYHLLRHTRLQSHQQSVPDVFNGHQTGNPTEFVNNDRHVVTLRAKLFQHPVYALTFRNDNRLT